MLSNLLIDTNNESDYHNTLSQTITNTKNLTTTSTSTAASTLEFVLVGLACAIVITLSLLGNALVVSVIIRYKRLQNATNYILLSLAIADLTVSILVMIPSMIQDIYKNLQFPSLFCKFYNSFDITCCTASILHLLLVAVDRYIAIFNPLSYRNTLRNKHVFLLVVSVWALSLLISFIPIFSGWNRLDRWNNIWDDHTTTNNTAADNSFLSTKLFTVSSFSTTSSSSSSSNSSLNGADRITFSKIIDKNDINNETHTNIIEQDFESCELEANLPYAIVSSSLSFYIPFVIMTVVYARIFVVARRQAQSIAENENYKSRKHSEELLYCNSHQTINNNNNNISPNNCLPLNDNGGHTNNNLTQNSNNNHLWKSYSCNTIQQNNKETTSRLHKIKQNKAKRKRRTKDTKAIKTLGIIMGIFIICWMPFFVMYVYHAACSPKPQCMFSMEIIRLITWIGYVNSFINPIVYALTNRDFRKAYISTLHSIVTVVCPCLKKFISNTNSSKTKIELIYLNNKNVNNYFHNNNNNNNVIMSENNNNQFITSELNNRKNSGAKYNCCANLFPSSRRRKQQQNPENTYECSSCCNCCIIVPSNKLKKNNNAKVSSVSNGGDKANNSQIRFSLNGLNNSEYNEIDEFLEPVEDINNTNNNEDIYKQTTTPVATQNGKLLNKNNNKRFFSAATFSKHKDGNGVTSSNENDIVLRKQNNHHHNNSSIHLPKTIIISKLLDDNNKPNNDNSYKRESPPYIDEVDEDEELDNNILIYRL